MKTKSRGRGKGKQSKKAGTGVWLPSENIKSRHFEKFIDCMVLKLSVYIGNVISLSYKPKQKQTNKQTNKTKNKKQLVR